jgi:hypothetical protein
MEVWHDETSVAGPIALTTDPVGDPPWQLTRRVLTAWFGVSRAVVELVMSPDLWPEESSTARGRLRFYDIVFKTLAGSASSPTAPIEGRFREAVVAFQERAGSVNGEVSLFMWTDSDPYMTGVREVFGWPLVRGRIDLSGPLWEDQMRAGARGTAMLSAPSGAAAMRIDDAWHETEERSAAPCWLTPRRVLRRVGLDDDTREVLIVRPTVCEPGVRYAVTSHATLNSRPRIRFTCWKFVMPTTRSWMDSSLWLAPTSTCCEAAHGIAYISRWLCVRAGDCAFEDPQGCSRGQVRWCY